MPEMRAGISHYLRQFLRHKRFPFLLALLGFAEIFLVFTPPDILLITEGAASPKRRKFTIPLVALGSALGSLALAFALRSGLSAIQPTGGMPQWWGSAAAWFDRYGTWALFAGAAAPIPVQPFVAGAVVSGFGLPRVFVFVLAGRLVKYSVLAFLPSFLPARFRSLATDQK